MVAMSLVAVSVYAGGSPLRTVIVVNRNSAQSLELGRYYAGKRGIPDHHIIPITTFVSNNIALASYSNNIEGPVRTYINENGLSNQVDHVVFSMDIPYRVYQPPFSDFRYAGLTATFYYGFYSSPNAFVSGCDLAAGSENPYFEKERSFSRNAPFSSNRLFLSAMITASNVSFAKRLVDRAVASDQLHPQGGLMLLRTSDPNRNVQWVEFEQSMYLRRFLASTQTWEWLDADILVGRTNVFGITTGQRNVTWIPLSTALPGAFAQHLTSFGGHLFDQIASQMSILDWIQGGYAGSHGTVVEPCAYTNKFASPRLHYWYARGFSLGECLWMSVRNPYQGVFVGDPLCAPYARPPVVGWMSLTNGSVVAGTIAVTGIVNAATSSRPVAHVSWYRDGRWQADITNASPRPGNVVELTIDGTTRSYTVAGGDTLEDVVAGMATAVNANPPLPYSAKAYGDRLDIRQKTVGAGAAGWAVSGSVLPGTASVVHVQLSIPATNFLETTFAARELITLAGNAVSGDVVRIVITRLDGVVVTNDTFVSVDIANNFVTLQKVAETINSNPAMQSVDGALMKYVIPVVSGSKTNSEAWLFARTNTWEGSGATVDVSVIRMPGSTLGQADEFIDGFNDNGENLKSRATVFFSAGVTQVLPVLNVDTTVWPDGPHVITLAASEGSGVASEGRATLSVVIDNHDLSCVITSPADRLFRLASGTLTVQVVAAATIGSVTQAVLYAEGKAVSTGLTSSVILSEYGAGPLRLQAQAWDDLGRSTLSIPVTVNLYTDVDGDGISDQWEYDHFGAFTNVAGSADSDGDGISNHDEYFADTQPTNSASFLAVLGVDDPFAVQFETSSNRLYRMRFNDGDLPITSAWYAGGDFFPGNGGIGVVTNAPVTNAVRFYAVEPALLE